MYIKFIKEFLSKLNNNKGVTSYLKDAKLLNRQVTNKYYIHLVRLLFL